MSRALDLSPVRLWVRLRIRLWVRIPRRPAAAPTGPWARAHRHKSTLYYKLKDCASIDRSNNARRHANRDLQLPVVTGPSVVAGRLAVESHRLVRPPPPLQLQRARPNNSTLRTSSLRLRLRLECAYARSLECAYARSPKRPLRAVELQAIFAVRIPLIKSDSNVTR